MLDAAFILQAFILPGVFAFLLVLAALHPRLPKNLAQVLPHLAMTLPFVLAWLALFGVPLLPPRSVVNWLFYFCIIACVLDILMAAISPPVWVRLPLTIATLAAAIVLIARSKIDFHWPLSHTILLLTLFITVAALLALSYENLARDPGPSAAFTVGFVVIAATTFCLALTVGRSPAQLLVTPTATLLGTLPLGRRFARAPILLTLLPIPPLLAATLYSDFSPITASLLVGAPLVSTLAAILTHRFLKHHRLISIVLATAIPLIAAIALSIHTYTNRPQ